MADSLLGVDAIALWRHGPPQSKCYARVRPGDVCPSVAAQRQPFPITLTNVQQLDKSPLESDLMTGSVLNLRVSGPASNYRPGARVRRAGFRGGVGYAHSTAGTVNSRTL